MNEPLSIRVEVETVTPLFLGGAEGKNGPPDLRVPPFRGAMRYWWRGALGGVIGDGDFKALKQAEEAVFGSTNRASLIGLRIPFKDLDLKYHDKPILPHKGQAWSEAFEEKQRFELVMSQYGNQPIEVWRAAYTSLELALTFGGVGLRSRRGHGTLRVTNVDGKGLVTTPTTRREWKAHIKRVTERAIRAAFNLCKVEKIIGFKGLSTGPAKFPCATKAGVIRLGEAQYHSPMDAVVDFMSKVQNKPFVGGISPRQASPLWVRPVQMDNKYGLLFVVLASRFNRHDYDALNQLLSRFKGENIRVKGWNA